MTAHAKNRAPSAAKRWLSCPQSAYITPMYPNDDTDASLKGDYWHTLMEDRIIYGACSGNAEPDAQDAMDELYAYVERRVQEMGGPKHVKVFVEVKLDIEETGEFGTADIILVSDREIEIIDEKSGYVPVNIKLNPQLMVYLLGAISKHGERKKYKLTIHQPNYDHIDGTIRSYEPTDEDIEWVRGEIRYSMRNDNEIRAGKHCKETYCPHRGACEAFIDYVGTDLILGWFPSEVRAMSDDKLSGALDAADEVAGLRNELRVEAMRRIMNMDRTIHGYKVVKGRRNRATINEYALVDAVRRNMGAEWAARLFPDLAWMGDELVMLLNIEAGFPQGILKSIGTPKHIEDVIKQYAKKHYLPNGAWKKIYDNVVGEYIRETANGLTLEKAIDGRPAHKRGSEFGPLVLAPQANQDGQAITII